MKVKLADPFTFHFYLDKTDIDTLAVTLVSNYLGIGWDAHERIHADGATVYRGAAYGGQ